MEIYQSILIHPQVHGGRCSGQLQISVNELVFTSEEILYKISFSNLSINAGGAGNRFVFFKDKTQEEISIYTSDKAVLKNSYIAANHSFKKEVSDSHKALKKPLIAIFTVIVLIAAFIGSLFFFKDAMVESLANQVPLEWEKTAGDKLFNTLSLQYHFIKNDSLKKEFMKVGAPLFSQVEKQGYKIDLYFVNDPTINAFALPGGKVIIQSGLIQNAKSWEEVMGVLSHELAHVTRRHHIRGIINNVGIFVILSAVVGDVSALTGVFANVGGELASLSNSRDFENEADETGLQYLEKGKINPAGMISFFETLKKEHATALDSTLNSTVDLSFLSTHPDTQARIDNLKNRVKDIDQKDIKPLPANFEDFKKALLKVKEE